MIGISPDAWQAARKTLGQVEAHVAVAAILQRSIHSSEAVIVREEGGGELVTVNGSPAIQSPGGYLRSLVEQAELGKFSVGPLLMALIGQRLKTRRAGGLGRGPSRVTTKADRKIVCGSSQQLGGDWSCDQTRSA